MSIGQPPVELGNTASYQNKLIALLGGQDPIEVLSKSSNLIEAFVRDNDAATLRARPFAGKWTPLEIIGHLVDAEYLYAYRIRLILCEQTPTIQSMDQELWVSGQRYNERDPKELFADFRALRQMNVRLWRGVGPDDVRKFGRHAERGDETLGTMLRMHAGHDLSHIDQITRYLGAIRVR